MNSQQSDYYQYLGIERDATASQIEAAVERKRSGWAGSPDAPSESDLSFLDYVYEVLSDSQRREVYDSLLIESSAAQLTLNVQASQENLSLIDIPQILYLLIDIQSPMAGAQKVQPLNLCLVVDCSTSMRGERLEQVKKGLHLLVDKLSDGDLFSLVRFSDRAQVIIDSGHMAKQKEVGSKIDSLKAAGGTEIFQGLSAGQGQIQQAPIQAYNNHLILITDGKTYGDEEKSLDLAGRLAEERIKLAAFGIGNDWDDQFLDALAGASGGHLEYIESAEDIISVLQKNVQGMGQVIADRVLLRSKWPQGLKLLDCFRLSPFAQPLSKGNGQIDLGRLEVLGPLRVLLEFQIKPQTIPTRMRIPLKVEVKGIKQGKRKLEKKVSISIIKDADLFPPPAEIVRAVRLLTLHRLNEKVWQEVEAGEVKRATVRLNYLATRFLEAGEDDLAQQAQHEAARLSRMATLSPNAYKNLRYGTRSLMGITVQLKEDD